MESFEKIGNGANYDGYGVDEKGNDKNRDDLEPTYYEGKDEHIGVEYEPGQFAAEAADDIAFEEHLKELAEQKKRGEITLESTNSVDPAELKDVKAAAPGVVPSAKVAEKNPKEQLRFVGKDGYIYGSRQEAIDSFKD